MQAIKPQIIDRAVHAVLPLSYQVLISNILTCICTTNGRPTFLRDWPLDTLSRWRTEAANYARIDRRRQNIKAIIDNLGKSGASPLAIMLQSFDDVAARLVSQPVYHRNAGDEMAGQLLQSSAWETKYVTTPAMGYPRRYLSLVPSMPAEYAPFLIPSRTPPTGVANTEPREPGDLDPTDFTTALDELAMLWDRHAFSSALIPEAKNIASRDPKEPLWGQIEASERQADRIASIGLLYPEQGERFMHEATHSLFTFARDQALLAYPKDRPVIEAYFNYRQAVLDLIPLHPLLSTIAHSLDQLTISTYLGEKPAMPMDLSCHLFELDDSTSASSRENVPAIAQAYLVHAFSEFAHFSSVKDVWPTEWVKTIAPTLPAKLGRSAVRIPEGYTTLGGIMDRLVRIQHFVKQWPEIIRALGWSSPLSSTPIKIEAAGADIVLCDGDYMSDNPNSVLLGMRPSYSLGNTLASGFSRRFASSFGTGPDADDDLTVNDEKNGGLTTPVRQTWSTLPAAAYRTSSGHEDVVAQFYMPPGMSMGEQNVDPRRRGESDDPIGLMVEKYYTDKSPGGYVRFWYGDPAIRISKMRETGLVMVSDWDVAVSGATREIQSLLLQTYGPANVDKEVNAYLYRERWNERIPVRLARENRVVLLDEQGLILLVQDFDGHVVFDDHIDLTHDVSVLDAFREMIVTKEPALLEPGATEVQPPEEEVIG